MAELLVVLGLATIPAAANLAGGLLAEVRPVSDRTLSLALHGAAGIVLAVVAIELMPEVLALLANPVTAYGKAAIVGLDGELEHAAAVLHPKMGAPIRAAIGGGEAIIPSTSKVAAAGAAIDVPLGHRHNVWSFDEIDTLTVSVTDAPRPDEIVVVIAVSDGPRPHARVGKGRAA